MEFLPMWSITTEESHSEWIHETCCQISSVWLFLCLLGSKNTPVTGPRLWKWAPLNLNKKNPLETQRMASDFRKSQTALHQRAEVTKTTDFTLETGWFNRSVKPDSKREFSICQKLIFNLRNVSFDLMRILFFFCKFIIYKYSYLHIKINVLWYIRYWQAKNPGFSLCDQSHRDVEFDGFLWHPVGLGRCRIVQHPPLSSSRVELYAHITDLWRVTCQRVNYIFTNDLVKLNFTLFERKLPGWWSSLDNLLGGRIVCMFCAVI